MKCSYCKGEIEPGRGIIHVKADGKVSHYCGSKCENNMKLGRKPANLKWINKKRLSKKEKRESKALKKEAKKK